MARVLNKIVLETGARTKRLMTMGFLGVELETGSACYLSAGHPFPLTVDTQGNTRPLKCSGNRLGHGAEPKFDTIGFEMAASSKLFLYTDGLVENRGPTGKSLEIRELKSALTRACTGSVAQARDDLLTFAKNIWQGFPPEDDCSFLFLEWDKREALV